MLFCWLEFWWIYIIVSCHSVTLNWYLGCSILPVSPCTRCFGHDSKGIDGAADLLEVLGKAMTLERLDFDRCSQIPAAAWQQLHGADWRNLKMAWFDRQLGRGRGDVSWNWYLLFPLALVGDVNTCFGWMLRSHVDWLGMLFSWLEFWWIYIGVSCHSVTLNWDLSCSTLPVSPCARCFGHDSKGIDGAADLLEVLGKAMTLERLDVSCSQIPAAAWQRVPSGAWPKLKPSNAFGVPAEELQRFGAPSGGLREWRGLQFVLIRADEVWQFRSSARETLHLIRWKFFF